MSETSLLKRGGGRRTIYARPNTEKRVEMELLRRLKQQAEEAIEAELYVQTLEKIAVASAALLETIEKAWNIDKVVTTKSENSETNK